MPADSSFSLRSTLLAYCTAGALCVAANACGDGPASPSGFSGNANLSVMLTDAPIDDVEQVNIYFTSVTVKPEGKPVQELTLELSQNPVNLLALTDRTIGFAAGVVEPARYEFMHINIDQSRSNLVENGVRRSLRVPSQEVKILGGFTVDDEHTTTVTLDFDAKDSLVHLGNGDWLLRPVIVMADRDTRPRR